MSWPKLHNPLVNSSTVFPTFPTEVHLPNSGVKKQIGPNLLSLYNRSASKVY